MKVVQIDGENLRLEDVEEVALKGAKIKIAQKAITKIKKCRNYVEEVIRCGETVYGLNTGVGKLCRVKIKADEIEKLQRNLILSHAISFGPIFSQEEVRATMLLRANVLAKGNSGVRVKLVQTLVDMLNKGVHPMIPEKGSVGASGDLAPLAFIGLVMIGEGWAFYKGKLFSGKEALKKAGIKPLQLLAKEGLAMINGTQVMTAVGVLTLLKAERLIDLADMSGALSAEAALCTPVAFDEKIQKVRKFKGQAESAKNLRNLMKNSQIREFHKACPKVQDPYSFRCMPQVHGAVRDSLRHVRGVLETEINSATDNPLIFPDQGQVISGGNFHGEPVALAMDLLGIALSDLANMSERRTAALMDPDISDLPPFLMENPGVNSGFGIMQIAAAALVSENKVLAHPASVDTVPTSINQEDHVSMGTIASRKAREITDNVESVLSIEFLSACQGIDLRAPLKPGDGTGKIHRKIRTRVKKLIQDRIMMGDILRVKELMEDKFGM